MESGKEKEKEYGNKEAQSFVYGSVATQFTIRSDSFPTLKLCY